jgi:prepilin-type N-terminal cleavage/methylation domain-containing protein
MSQPDNVKEEVSEFRLKCLSSEKGYSLIEVLIAFAIFSIGFLAVAAMQVSASKGNRLACENSEAAAIAANIMENLMILPFDHSDLDPAGNPHQNSQGNYDIQWTITSADTDADGVEDAKTVELQIAWNKVVSGDGRSINLAFVKPDI